MKHRRRALSVLALVLLFPVPALGDGDPFEGLSKEDIEEMERGELIISVESNESSPGRVVSAAFFIEQSIERSWELLRQPERQSEFTSRLKESILLDEQPDSKTVRFLLKILLLKIRYQVIHILDDEAYHLDISLDPGYDNDLAVFDGTWRLHPVDEGLTLARYRSTVRLASWVPGFAQRILARMSIVSALEAWKKWFDSGGSWRKR